MRFRKGKEPSAFRRWRSSNPEETSWDALDAATKATLRQALSREQQGVCCYCYGPVHQRARIEHIEARTPENLFAWENLALACHGGEGTREHHCDKNKGNRALRAVHPHRAPVLHATRVTVRGRLKGHASDEALREDIEDTLNLNTRRLVNARKAAIVGTTTGLPSGRWSPKRLEQVLREIRARHESGDPIDYHAWVEQWLQRKIRVL